jgi:primosomal protein N'
MNIIGFALCLENSDCDDLELNKVYPVVEAESNDPDTYVRVIDESEEDYIYPRIMFEMVALPNQVHERVLKNLAA